MANLIGIMGEPGSGKSTSLRNLNPEETYYCDCDGKGLNWKGWRDQYSTDKSNYVKTSFPQTIVKYLLNIAEKAPHHFDWDEQKFKGKIAGGLFNEREYVKNDGSIGRATNLAAFCKVDKIRSSDYKLPKDKILSSNNSSRANSDDFMSVPDGADEEMPFN